MARSAIKEPRCQSKVAHCVKATEREVRKKERNDVRATRAAGKGKVSRDLSKDD